MEPSLPFCNISSVRSSKEFRRNDPHQNDRRDHVAEAMAEPADPQVVLEAIKAAHAPPS
jgi:hypothetical protein